MARPGPRIVARRLPAPRLPRPIPWRWVRVAVASCVCLRASWAVADPPEAVPPPDTADPATPDGPESKIPALPFERIGVSEIVAASQPPPPATEPTSFPTPRLMNPVGVEDPFPDRIRPTRPREAAVLLSLGVGLTLSSLVMARLSLLPECDDRKNVSTCTVPNGADVVVRGGRLVGAVILESGGATFAALGGRALGRVLQQSSNAPFSRRRGLALGIGSLALVSGAASLAVGATLFATRLDAVLDIANDASPDQFVADDPESAMQNLALGNRVLGHVKIARVGLMALLAAPTLIAGGIALLAHRPRSRARNWAIRPQLSPSRLGISLSSRF